MLKQLKGSFLILISALMFGAYGLLSRGIEDYDVFYQTYVRCFVIALALLILGIFRKEFKRIKKEDIKWFVVVCLFTVFSIAPIVYAFKFLTLGTASFLFYGSLTIFTYILGFAFFKEKFTNLKLAVLILSTLGLLLIFSGNFGAALLLPSLMALLNGIASSGEVTFSKKISNNYSTTQISFVVFIVIAVSHLILSLLLNENQDITLITEHAPNVLAFAVASIIGMLAVIEGYKFLEPSVGAIIGLTEVVFSLMFGVLFFSESANINTLVGGLLIIAAAALPSWIEIKRRRRKNEIH